MNNIVYAYGDNLYLNITNRCPCNCTFCIRMENEGVGDKDSLWLEREPEAHEVIDAIKAYDVSKYNEFVFCGFGEPTERLDVLISIAKYIKEHFKKPIRLNTNGLSDLINGKETAPLLKDCVDIISISLNASDAKSYYELCKPVFGEDSYEAMKRFAVSAKDYTKTVFTIVDVVGEKEKAACKNIADSLGIELRIRTLIP